MTLKKITIENADRITCLVIGRAGIGKTSLLRSIPKDEAVLTLSAESGLLCVRDLVEQGRITGFEIKTLADLEEALTYLQTPEYQLTYKWIFLDSLTEIAAATVLAMQEKYPNKGDSFKLWGDYNDTLTRLIKAFRDLAPYNVVFTSLETIEQDDVKRRFIAPDMPGKQLKERLTSFFDEVFYMTSIPNSEGKEQRVFFTGPYENQPGKDRSGKLALVEKPHLGHIKNKILPKKGE